VKTTLVILHDLLALWLSSDLLAGKKHFFGDGRNAWLVEEEKFNVLAALSYLSLGRILGDGVVDLSFQFCVPAGHSFLFCP
jgi:hypothetical protein